MPVRINEADETSYEHVLDLWNWRMRCEGPFNAKDMQAQRRRTVLGSGALADGGTAGGVVGGEGAIFEHAPWDDPETRVAWHIKELEDAGPLPHTGPVRQPGAMWASQLARELDVCAQVVEVIWAFGQGGNEIGTTDGINRCWWRKRGSQRDVPGIRFILRCDSDFWRGQRDFQTVLVPAHLFRPMHTSGVRYAWFLSSAQNPGGVVLGNFAGKPEQENSVAKREASLKERKF
ncbi:hypothetical protein FRC07_000315 [Ceratobasidium sp. 392]|nr:hypothetical protein FRC07_000315 [Ceratobasidium sp. 392]